MSLTAPSVSVSGSFGFRPYKNAATNRDAASAATMPITWPPTTTAETSRRIIRTTPPQWSIHRPQPPTYLGYNPDSPQESFLRWIVWDNPGALIVMGVVMLPTSAVCGSLGGTLGRFAKPSPQE